MKYKLVDLVNISRLESLLRKFYNVTGIPSYIVDDNENLITACGYGNNLKSIYRVNCETKKVCMKSDNYIIEFIKNNFRKHSYIDYKYKNGFVDIGVPINISGEYIATLFYGQFLLDDPNPMLTLEKLESIGELYYEFADVIGEIAEKQLRQIEVNEELSKNNKKLKYAYEQLEVAKNKLMNKYNNAVKEDKIKTEFFSNISHELRTPINVMIAAVQMANSIIEENMVGNSKESVIKYTNIIRQNGYRLIKLINNLIDINKIEANYMDLELKNCNIVEIVEDITFSIVDYANNKGIELIFDTNVEEKIMACDIDKIERIILNLLSNSIKFTKSGGNISVNLFDNDDKINIIVKDTGIGIPREKQPYIFDRFIQADKSSYGAQEGSGIGLAIVKSLVEMHNGYINLISEEGRGSEFIIELPVKIIEENIKEKIKNNEFNKIDMINVEFSDIFCDN